MSSVTHKHNHSSIPSGFSDGIWSAARCQPVCLPDISWTYVSQHPSVSAAQHPLSSFWSGVSQHMDCWTGLVPHPPRSQQSVLEGFHKCYDSWLTNTRTHLSNKFQTHSCDKTWHVYRSSVSRSSLRTFSLFHAASMLLLDWISCFAEVALPSLCDRGNSFPRFGCSFWAELDCSQLIYSLTRL